MLRKLGLAVLAFVLASGIGMALASPAQAAPAGCTPAYTCQYRDLNWTGDLYLWSAAYIQGQPNRCLNLTASANNSATSLYNNTSANFYYWTGANCTETAYALFSGHSTALLSGTYNDRISSIQYIP